ncbi:uncharacterized protein Yka (UPF0111/DUF47 family) [Rhizobium leguminosarum]|uniref:Uncharacterized protein Yka (UPF0111/DUF47 family) n=1 Tax=Rhizobium leguminosarum TaxID=384 RepID=A0A7Z0DXK7_RHILE|nr:hypothetical protein [Rhizobium leguminosarum]NYJ10963.1 uncharacterized protein Yka (UPF0111/DUF47 family) [Rhizobium leguminosarum]
MGNGVGFVKGCFEQRAKLVEELAARSEEFCDLCDDFAMANNERARWDQSSAPERDERVAEYQELIDSMRVEIEQALDRAAIVPFRPPRQ